MKYFYHCNQKLIFIENSLIFRNLFLTLAPIIKQYLRIIKYNGVQIPLTYVHRRTQIGAWLMNGLFAQRHERYCILKGLQYEEGSCLITKRLKVSHVLPNRLVIRYFFFAKLNIIFPIWHRKY